MKVNLERALRRAIKTGKVYLGSKRTIKALKNGEARMVVVASNCPEELFEQIKSFNVPVVMFEGTNMDLGAICGKPFSVAAIAIVDAGESEILAAAEQ